MKNNLKQYTIVFLSKDIIEILQNKTKQKNEGVSIMVSRTVYIYVTVAVKITLDGKGF